jgi:hypothetical protein
MTHDGSAYELPTWEHLTADSESLYSPMTPKVLPTPTAMSATESGHCRNYEDLLHALTCRPETHLLASPRTSDSNGAGKHGEGGLDLRTQISLLSTPVNHEGGTRPAKPVNGQSLPVQISLMGTPTSRDWKGSGKGERLRKSLAHGQLEAQMMLLPTPNAVESDKRTTHAGGNPTLVEATTGISETDAARHGIKAGPLLPTPNAFHMGNTEKPDEWRARRLDVFQRTGTRHGAALSVIALSVANGDPLTPDRFMPDEISDDDPT